jgi:hypothetical protein
LKSHIYIFFFVLIVFFFQLNQFAIAQDFPKIIKIAGKAEILSNGRWSTAKNNQSLLVGQTIKLVRGNQVSLVSEGGNVEIIVSKRSAVKFNGEVPEASVPWGDSHRLVTAKSDLIPEIEVVEGLSRFSVKQGESLRVITPLIIAAVRGTDFTVSVAPDGSSEVIVAEGSVMVTGRDGKSGLVNRGRAYSFTAEQYADFLRKNKVKIPPEGWRNVPRQQLQDVDDRTFKPKSSGRAVHRSNKPPNNRPKSLS